MTVETAPDTDDLDAFEKLMFAPSEVVEQEAAPETEPEPVEEPEVEEETLEETEETEEEESETEEEAEKPEPKKSRFQERIDELVHKARESDREAAEYKSRLDAVLKKLEEQEAPKATPPQVKSEEPSAEDLDDTGEPKYPLGEFDPNYLRDLARFTVQRETELAREELRREREEQEVSKAQALLQEDWNAKLTEASENRYPDLKERAQNLIDVFKDIDQGVGEFLAAQIMGMDKGIDVLYHLATNPEEARKIVAAGPEKALLAFGRIEARYDLLAEEKTEKKLRVSAAPPPPERLNKGTSVSKDVAPDTDDLDAFEREFYRRKK